MQLKIGLNQSNGYRERVEIQGRYIKLINALGEVRLRVNNQHGDSIEDTIVKPGVAIDYSASPYHHFELIAEDNTEQVVEVWAGMHPMGYQAPTDGSNHNISSLIEHYGDSQAILPFELNRVQVTLFSEQPFWYGGQGVNMDNGIPVQANTPIVIPGSGELHIAVNGRAEYDVGQSAGREARSAVVTNYRDAIVDDKGGVYYTNKEAYTPNNFTKYAGLNGTVIEFFSQTGYECFAKNGEYIIGCNTKGKKFDYYKNGTFLHRADMHITSGIVQSVACWNGHFYYSVSGHTEHGDCVIKVDRDTKSQSVVFAGLTSDLCQFGSYIVVSVQDGSYIVDVEQAVFDASAQTKIGTSSFSRNSFATELDDYIVLSSQYLKFAYNKTDKTIFGFPAGAEACGVSRLGFTYIDMSGNIFVTNDSGATWESLGKVDELSLYSSRFATMLTVDSGALYVIHPQFFEVVSLAKRLNVKQTIRMLKEVV